MNSVAPIMLFSPTPPPCKKTKIFAKSENTIIARVFSYRILLYNSVKGKGGGNPTPAPVVTKNLTTLPHAEAKSSHNKFKMNN